MHPPSFSPNDRLSDWPDCQVEARCSKCRHVAFMPVQLIKASSGNLTFRDMLVKLRCGHCRAIPAPVFLLAGQHREYCWGARPDWAIELVPAVI